MQLCNSHICIMENDPNNRSPHETTAPQVGGGELDPYSKMLSEAVDAVSPSVVRLDLRHANDERAGSGSGVIVSPDGLVLTNSHVIRGSRRAEATTIEGRVLSARLLGDVIRTLTSLCCASMRTWPYPQRGSAIRVGSSAVIWCWRSAIPWVLKRV